GAMIRISSSSLRSLVVLLALSLAFVLAAPARAQLFDPARGMVLQGTVVTMDDFHSVIEDGSVLVRDDRIVAVWRGKKPPAGTDLGNAAVLDFGPSALIFPGMINLHDHPTFDALRLWPVPSSQIQPALGRPLGTEPYANRYQWNEMAGNASPELRRLVLTPQLALIAANGLNLEPEVVKRAKVKGLVGGQTTTQGATPRPEIDGLLARNAESLNFGRQNIRSRVLPIDTLSGAPLANLLFEMQTNRVDAWLVHLAEGVRDG